MKIVRNHYGKSRVRVARVVREGDQHEFHELTIAILLEGDFDSSYTAGDNTLVLPTDTMKNTVYALAKDKAISDPESFGLLLAEHFLHNNTHVTRVKIELSEHVWLRNGPTSFTSGGSHKRVAWVNADREQAVVEGGVTGYVLLKTTGSAFLGFIKDRYTTLPEASDRIFSTSLDARWRYQGQGITWRPMWQHVVDIMTDIFASHDSLSVQHTLCAIGEGVLEKFAAIEEIKLTMPNKHYLPVNLLPFGLENTNEVFCPVDEPHGLIEAVIAR